jgi:hypothetical protein
MPSAPAITRRGGFPPAKRWARPQSCMRRGDFAQTRRERRDTPSMLPLEGRSNARYTKLCYQQAFIVLFGLDSFVKEASIIFAANVSIVRPL